MMIMILHLMSKIRYIYVTRLTLILLFAVEVLHILPPDPAENYEGVEAVIAGWGAFNYQAECSTLIGRGMSRLDSHWSRGS